MGTKKGMKRKTARRAYTKDSKKYVKDSKKYKRDMDFFVGGGGVFANFKLSDIKK